MLAGIKEKPIDFSNSLINNPRNKSMKEVTKAAKRANMKSRACKNCPIKQRLKICPPEIFEVCSAAFIEGFKKGVKAAQKAIKESNNPNVFLDSGKRS